MDEENRKENCIKRGRAITAMLNGIHCESYLKNMAKEFEYKFRECGTGTKELLLEDQRGYIRCEEVVYLGVKIHEEDWKEN